MIKNFLLLILVLIIPCWLFADNKDYYEANKYYEQGNYEMAKKYFKRYIKDKKGKLRFYCPLRRMIEIDENKGLNISINEVSIYKEELLKLAFAYYDNKEYDKSNKLLKLLLLDNTSKMSLFKIKILKLNYYLLKKGFGDKTVKIDVKEIKNFFEKRKCILDKNK